MKTLKITSEANRIIQRAYTYKIRVVSINKSILLLLMLSGMIGLSSCAVSLRTPRPQRHGIVFLQHSRSARPVYREHQKTKIRHDNGKHLGQEKHSR